MHSAKRRDRHRRIRNTNCTWQYPHYTSQVFDQLEYLTQKLEYTLPSDTISQAIITTDYYLAYTLGRHLFSGARTAIFQTIESAKVSLRESVISQLVVDMEGLTISYFDVLEYLRQLIKPRNNIQIFILLSRHDEDLIPFISLSGPFYILSRSLRLPEMRPSPPAQAAAAARDPSKIDPRESSTSALPSFIEEIERKAIEQALTDNRYNKTKAAAQLGITFRALRYKLKKLGIE